MYCKGVLPCIGIYPLLLQNALPTGDGTAREKKVRNDHEKTTAQHPAYVLYGADTAANSGLC